MGLDDGLTAQTALNVSVVGSIFCIFLSSTHCYISLVYSKRSSHSVQLVSVHFNIVEHRYVFILCRAQKDLSQ